MITIEVNASKSYQVHIGSGLLSQLGQRIKSLSKAQKVTIVSDTNVFPLYGETAANSLQSAGFQVLSFVFPAGEESKNAETYLQLLNFLAEKQVTRADCLIALGGGVVGDLTGFTAATYLRGVDYVQVPTTVLAAVDSSVGGKTAIDLPVGKNLVGAFYQPKMVLCDTDTLNTLPEDIFRDGCAEVIKYGVLYDPKLFDHLLQHGICFQREQVIARCVTLKRDVVLEDEFDTGARMKLNLGHTIGHGVEAKSNFTVSHGKAVAIGMCVVAKAAAACGYCTEAVRDLIISAVKRFDLPTCTEYDAQALFTGALSDKKRSGSHVDLIIPFAIGDCRITPLELTQIQSFIQAGL